MKADNFLPVVFLALFLFGCGGGGGGSSSGGSGSGSGSTSSSSSSGSASITGSLCPSAGGPSSSSSSSSSGSSSSSSSSSGGGAPAASTLSLGFGIKQLQFSWTESPDATDYRLLRSTDGGASFTDLGEVFPAGTTQATLDIAVHGYDWDNTLYQLLACNGPDCTASNTVATSLGDALQAIGYFKASNTGSGDFFGDEVVISADGNTLAIGAPYEDSNAVCIGGAQDNDYGFDSGAVYIYTRDNGVWNGTPVFIKAPNPDFDDQFGRFLALSDDGGTLAVGVYEEDGDGSRPYDNSATTAGAVYIYVRSGDTWNHEAYIKASDADEGDYFGHSVALSENGDTLAVGAMREDGNIPGSDAGAVYIYTRSGAQWSEEAVIRASNQDIEDQFGETVSLSADGNTLAVGARLEDSDGSHPLDNYANDAGAVYIYTRNGTAWGGEVYIKASNSDERDQFGYAVALSADGDTLAVGAPTEDGDGTGPDNDLIEESGAVYVFTRNNGSWDDSPVYIKASNPGMYDSFGSSVALSGDGDTLVVGAEYEASVATGIDGDQSDNSDYGNGAAYVYRRTGANWSNPPVYIKAINVPGSFGMSVALDEDGDVLAVSAIRDESNATGIGGDPHNGGLYAAGAVFLY